MNKARNDLKSFSALISIKNKPTIRNTIFLVLLLIAFSQLHAQVTDPVSYIARVDSIVKVIDNKKSFRVSVSDATVIDVTGRRYPIEAFTEYFIHDTISNALLKIFYEPSKKYKFATTYYMSNDSLIYVCARERNKKNGRVNSYYVINNNLLKKVESIHLINPDYYLKQWARMRKEDKNAK